MKANKNTLWHYSPRLRANIKTLSVGRCIPFPRLMVMPTKSYSSRVVAKSLASFKHVQTLQFEKKLITLHYLKSIRLLTNLQNLSIDLTMNNIKQYPVLLQNLTHLRRLELHVSLFSHYKCTISDEKCLYQFFKILSSLKNLKDLHLILEVTLQSGIFPLLETILFYIGESKIEYFHIQAHLVHLSIQNLLNNQNTFNVEKASSLLAQIDYLSLSMLNNKFLSKIPETKTKHKKILELCLNQFEGFDMTAVLNKCKSLETLFLSPEIINIMIKLKENVKFPQSLHNLFVIFSGEEGRSEYLFNLLISSLEKVESLTQFSLCVNQFGKEELFVKLMKLKCLQNIKNLSLLLEVNRKYPTPVYNNTFENICKQIESKKSLKRLEIKISLERSSDLHCLATALRSLSHLKHLKLTLYVEEKDWRLYIPFEVLPHLVSLELFSLTNISEDCAEHFAKNIVKLKDLKRLSLQNEILYKLNTEEYNRLIEDLSQANKLDKLNIVWKEKIIERKSCIEYKENPKQKKCSKKKPLCEVQ